MAACGFDVEQTGFFAFKWVEKIFAMCFWGGRFDGAIFYYGVCGLLSLLQKILIKNNVLLCYNIYRLAWWRGRAVRLGGVYCTFNDLVTRLFEILY